MTNRRWSSGDQHRRGFLGACCVGGGGGGCWACRLDWALAADEVTPLPLHLELDPPDRWSSAIDGAPRDVLVAGERRERFGSVTTAAVTFSSFLELPAGWLESTLKGRNAPPPLRYLDSANGFSSSP